MTEEMFVKITDMAIESIREENSYSCLVLKEMYSLCTGVRYCFIPTSCGLISDYSETFGVGLEKTFDDVENPQNSRLAALELYKEMCLADKRYAKF